MVSTENCAIFFGFISLLNLFNVKKTQILNIITSQNLSQNHLVSECNNYRTKLDINS